MTIEFTCACGTRLNTPDGTGGRLALCPRCRRRLRVPEISIYETVAELAPARPPHGMRRNLEALKEF